LSCGVAGRKEEGAGRNTLHPNKLSPLRSRSCFHP